MAFEKLRSMANFLHNIYECLKMTESSTMEFPWAPTISVPRRPYLRNDETQLLFAGNFLWIANNCNEASNFQALYLDAHSINTIAELDGHVVKNSEELKKILAPSARTPVTSKQIKAINLGILEVVKIRGPEKRLASKKSENNSSSSSSSSAASSSSSSSSSYLKTFSFVTISAGIAERSVVSGNPNAGLCNSNTEIGFVTADYTSAGDKRNFHAEQRLLFALSMLDTFKISGKRIAIIGTKPPCDVCKPKLELAQTALQHYRSELQFDTNPGRGEGDGSAMHESAFEIPLRLYREAEALKTNAISPQGLAVASATTNPAEDIAK